MGKRKKKKKFCDPAMCGYCQYICGCTNLECASCTPGPCEHRKQPNVPLTGWVSVKDKVPEKRNDVLTVVFWHETWQVRIGWYSGEEWHVNVGLGDKTGLSVTYWMPLPEPPEVAHE